MAAHSLETLLRLWALNKLTTEQAIGQILQILNELEPRVKRLEQSVAAVPASLPAPTPPPNPTPAPPVTKPPKRARRA
ncbi:MAG: hypothetical protein HY741_05545 [Chloroflexi bacterium]|nr:hypothetical protein [Chloroflexota bacterium]